MKWILPCLLCQIALASALSGANVNPITTPLTFRYQEDQLRLYKNCPIPKEVITNEQLTRLNNEATYLIRTTKLSSVEKTILPAYLANAQKDFAWISYRLTGKFTGDLGPVTLWTLRLFIPDANLPSVNVNNFDPYSSGIAALVVSRAASRLYDERKQFAKYPIQRGSDKWSPTAPGYRGLEYGTAKTWYLTSSKEFEVETPQNDGMYWLDQTQEILNTMDKRNGDETELVYWWANLPSPDAGEWSSILQQYFKKNRTPLANRLWAKAVFESAFLDSNAAAFNSKYTFWIKRPSQTNREVNPLITVPNHPSYPSAHSTIAAAVAVVLTELFPENEKEWNRLAEEAGMSRIWGGIHYPADHEKGKDLGEKIGMTVNERAQ